MSDGTFFVIYVCFGIVMRMEYTKEATFAKALALKAGEIIRTNFSHSKSTIKSNLTPVTETDIAISKLVISEVKQHFPNHVVLDEELQQNVSEDEYIWVCDPIDGTIPFAYHVPTSVFSLSLCKRGKPVVSVIYDPYMDRMLYTESNAPSYMNDTKIHVRKDGLSAGDFIYGIPYWNEQFDTNTYLKLLMKKGVRVTYIESIVYQSMLVASGLTQAMATVAANPWDRAAALHIVENAGGICTDESGQPLSVFGDPKLFIASNRIVHKELMDIVHQCFPHNT